jgi:hypothetical protein
VRGADRLFCGTWLVAVAVDQVAARLAIDDRRKGAPPPALAAQLVTGALQLGALLVVGQLLAA